MLDKDIVITSNMIALARRKKKGKSANIRSKMLKMIMPLLSRENGDKLAHAIDTNNSGEFAAVWDTIKKEIKEKLNGVKHHEARSVSLSAMEHTTSESSTDDMLDVLFSDVIHEMESSSVDYNYHNYANVIAGKGSSVELVREFVANGSVKIEGNSGEYVLKTKSIRVKPSSNSLLANVEVSMSADLYNTASSERIRTYSETGCTAVAATEIILKVLSHVKNTNV